MKRSPVFICFCFLFSFLAAAQQPGEQSFKDVSQMPEGIRGQRITALIDAVNANSAAAVEAFITAHCTEGFRTMAPMGTHVDVFRSFFRETGGIGFHSVRTYVPEREEAVIILQDKLFESWKAFSLNFSGNSDLIAGIQFSPARTPTNVEREAISTAELGSKLEKLLNRLCKQDAFSGAVLVARGETVVFSKACGEASKRFRADNDLHTKFNLGSMNKMFTATAILQLVEKGTLALDSPISQFVDESWLPKSITDEVTVHHLLTHTSGLGNYFNDTYWNSSRELFRAVEDYKPLVQGDTLSFEPGSRFQYSNTGMLLLGVVIEKATGQDYFDYIREHIYQVAGMDNSDSYDMSQPVENLAIGYIPAPENEWGWENNLYKHVIKGGPAGGGFSTVIDLHRFALALQAEKLVSKSALEKMWKAHTDRYGYGFSVESGPAGKVVGHGGGFPGLNGNLDIFLDKGYIVAILSNYDRAASPLAANIYQMIASLQEN